MRRLEEAPEPVHFHPVRVMPMVDLPHGAGPAFTEVRETALAMVAEGQQEEALEFLLAALAAVLTKSRDLELLLAKLRRAGRRSERVDPKQLALLFEELMGQIGTDADAPDPEEEARADATTWPAPDPGPLDGSMSRGI